MVGADKKGGYLTHLRYRIEASIAAHRGWYIAQAIVFILAGILAMVLPGLTAIGFEILIGALLVASGLVQGFVALRAPLQWWAIISSVFSLVAGGLMLFNPVAGTLALAMILAIFLTVEGGQRIISGLSIAAGKTMGVDAIFGSGLFGIGGAVIFRLAGRNHYFSGFNHRH